MAALVVAAGRGTRAGGERPKQYQPLGRASVLAHTIAALAGTGRIGRLVVVIHPDDAQLFRAEVPLPADVPVAVVAGGASRAASVQAGLAALADRADYVLVHDGARPLVTGAVVARVLSALQSDRGAAPALRVTDALWSGSAGLVTGTRDRDGLWRAQTPQGFPLRRLAAAHADLAGNTGPEPADDVEVARAVGLDVAIVEGDEDNIKITTPADFPRAAAILARRAGSGPDPQAAMDIRLGNGFDVHRFGPGDGVVLCGVRVPHAAGLEGHSDADVGLHAITDAIYGALAEGDIGQHFPPSDPQWKGADSTLFLRHAADRARDRGFRIANIDCTLICERPKIGPHAAAMRSVIAELLGLAADRVSVKATTSERLGFTGRGEGIAALATVALVPT